MFENNSIITEIKDNVNTFIKFMTMMFIRNRQVIRQLIHPTTNITATIIQKVFSIEVI